MNMLFDMILQKLNFATKNKSLNEVMEFYWDEFWGW